MHREALQEVVAENPMVLHIGLIVYHGPYRNRGKALLVLRYAKWIQKAPSRGPARAVLLSLAVLAGPKGQCKASLNEIARMSGTTKRTVVKSLAQLEQSGQVAVKREFQPKPSGGHRKNEYRLLFERKRPRRRE